MHPFYRYVYRKTPHRGMVELEQCEVCWIGEDFGAFLLFGL